MHRHLSSLSQVMHVACKLMSHLLNRKPSPKECTSLSVLREYHIVIFNSCCAAYTCCFLTELSHIETYTGLSLSLVIHDICLIHHDHSAEHFLHCGIIDTSLEFLINYVSLLIEYAEALNLVECTAELHLICEFVLKQVPIDFIHGSEGTR